MELIKRKKNETLSMACKAVDTQKIGKLRSETARRILEILAVSPNYPRKIATELKVNEQKVYYHIKELERGGIVALEREEVVKGTLARYYTLTSPAYAITFGKFRKAQKIGSANESEFLEPFIVNGEIKAKIVIGSPDPHGPQKARSKDGYYGIDLALFLGTFLNYVPELTVRLDTEVRDLKQNLIVVGGPIVNTVMGKINSKLPVKFTDKSVYSTVTHNEYFSEETGVIQKVVNPYDKSKKILVIAGRRHAGTRACIIAFLKMYNEVVLGNKHKRSVKAKVVEGVDLDSDGIVDSVEVLE